MLEQKEEQGFNQRLLHIFDIFLTTSLTLVACYQGWEVTEKYLSRPQEVNIFFDDLEDLPPVDISVCYVFNVGNCSYPRTDQDKDDHMLHLASSLFSDGYGYEYNEGYEEGYEEDWKGRLKIRGNIFKVPAPHHLSERIRQILIE